MKPVFMAITGKNNNMMGLASPGLLTALDMNILFDESKLKDFLNHVLDEDKIKVDEVEMIIVAVEDGMLIINMGDDTDPFAFAFRKVDNPAAEMPKEIAQAFTELMKVGKGLGETFEAIAKLAKDNEPEEKPAAKTVH